MEFEKTVDALSTQVGDQFFRQTLDEDGNPIITTPTCISIEKIDKECTYYNMVTSQSLNFFADGFLGSTGISNMYTFEKTEDGRYIHNQDQLTDTKENGDVFSYDMFDSSVITYEMYVAYRLGETKNMADILANTYPYNQYPIEQVYQIAIQTIVDYFPDDYHETMVSWPDTFLLTSSDGLNIRVERQSTYILLSPANSTNFVGWYNTFDGKVYKAGEEMTVYMNAHLIARYE